MKKSSITRRHFLQFSGLGSLGFLAGRIGLRHLSPAQASGNPTHDVEINLTAALSPAQASGNPTHDVEINLTAAPAQQSILTGQATTVWKYTASLVRGDTSNLVTVPNTYLGPIIHLRTGQRVRINFTNNIAEESIVHWHGLHVPHEADGHPSAVISTGETYVYEFDVLDRAGTYWYHPHPHGRTGPQAYMGLAGLFVISDEDESAAGLPTGNYDLPLAIQDRTFDASNQLIYYASPMGFLGDQILVNGQPNASHTVENVPHRLRILNGSNSRIYKLAWADGTPLTIIGTDGGLLDTAVSRNYVTLSPGERIEMLVDFGQWAVGSTVELRSLAFSGGHFGGGGGVLPNGAEFPVMIFKVNGSDVTPTPTPNPDLTPEAYLPVVLNQQQNSGAAHLASRSQDATRSFSLYMQQGVWTINGRTFEMMAVANDEIVTLGDTEIWEFENSTQFGGGGMMMGQPHPMHIHSLQFRVLGRIPPSNSIQHNNWLTVKDGFVDSGWKDTVLLMPGEKVQVEVAFKDYTGLFLYHCHNLEHEDMGMMRNFEVRAYT